MFAHRPIRHKLILMLLLLLVFMTAGSLAGLTGVWSYRTTVKSIRNHAEEKPDEKTLRRWVTNLRVNIKEIETLLDLSDKWADRIPFEVKNEQKNLRQQFETGLTFFATTLASYKLQMEKRDRENALQIGSSNEERQTVRKINICLKKIEKHTSGKKIEI